MADNVKFAVIFKWKCPIDGPCRSDSKSTFNLKITAGFLEKSTFKKNKIKYYFGKKSKSKKIPLKFLLALMKEEIVRIQMTSGLSTRHDSMIDNRLYNPQKLC